MKHSYRTPANPLFFKKERWTNSKRYVSWFVVLTTIFVFFVCYSQYPSWVPTQQDLLIQEPVLIQPNKDDEKCDFFTGHWIPDLKGSLYTNWSCSTIPDSKNCGKHGRQDVDFVNWRWKPHGCELPRFQPKTFLRAVQGKTLAFIGDSVARNQMESLLCLLSQEETPIDIYKDSEDRFRTWYFPSHSFTLKVLWSKFLVTGEERTMNESTGIYDVHLDKIDNNWGGELNRVDYAVISDGHWFFRKIYLYEGGNLIGCVFCNEANVTGIDLRFALRKAFRKALKHINRCKECSRVVVTLVRTLSPPHFEGGAWNTGGNCNRTSPLREGEDHLGGSDWELRSIQAEEAERARKEGRKRGKRFAALDITRAMLMRPDGHPGSHWNNIWMKGFNDCIHWCLPGPIDAWNDLLMAMLRKEVASLSLMG